MTVRQTDWDGFVVYLEGDDGFPASTAAAFISHMGAAAEKLAKLGYPNKDPRCVVVGLRQGSLGIGMVLQGLDALSQASPTAHAIVCFAMCEVFRLLAVRLVDSAKADDSISSKSTEIAHNAIQDKNFRHSLASALEVARTDKKVSGVGIGSPVSRNAEVSLPPGYFVSAQTGLALPNDYFIDLREEILSPLIVLVSPDDDKTTDGKRWVYWDEGRHQLSRALVDLGRRPRLRAAMQKAAHTLHRLPIAVVDLVVVREVNTATLQSVVLSAKIKRVRKILKR